MAGEGTDAAPAMRVFAVVGPSGAGKDTLIAAAAAARPELHVVRRVITRPEEAGGEPFEGVDDAEFARRRAAGDFALDWAAHGLCYGIPATALRAAEAGRTVVFNGSRAVLPAAERAFPGLSVVFVTARPEVLADRLAARGREGRQEIAARLMRAGAIAPPEGRRVRTVLNEGDLATAVAAFLACLQAEPERA